MPRSIRRAERRARRLDVVAVAAASGASVVRPLMSQALHHHGRKRDYQQQRRGNANLEERRARRTGSTGNQAVREIRVHDGSRYDTERGAKHVRTKWHAREPGGKVQHVERYDGQEPKPEHGREATALHKSLELRGFLAQQPAQRIVSQHLREEEGSGRAKHGTTPIENGAEHRPENGAARKRIEIKQGLMSSR